MLVLFWPRVLSDYPKTHQKAGPDHPRNLIYPNVFLNLYSEGASLASVERLFHILVPRKEKAFCPCPVFSWAAAHPYLCCGGYGKDMHYF